MRIKEKIILFEQLHSEENLNIELFYEVLEKCDALKQDYMDYMISEPVDCDQELDRLKDADYDLCCALLTMLLREDYFCNGMFERRQRLGQVDKIIDRILLILKESSSCKQSFSEKALIALDGYYVYALIDPRDNKVFYIGKGVGNRVFMHEIESGKSLESEKLKLKKIRDIENAGFSVKKLIVNWGLTESEAFAAEATLINMLNYIRSFYLYFIII